ncbi:unannotated protein [freshwater metagenome]|uniref:Unannotated protein n=1 Tax=freshwater metagenome TaxID=449393 RepID=A0A6J7IHT4_9ZZZZ|nr:alcohol dehydrogenase catalytic domain-containing protein [Actinomycetota bacterium]MSW36015.1 alcohol dehydrogenase catalytic domain-containing protein [Actinomycetota bacterium]
MAPLTAVAAVLERFNEPLTLMEFEVPRAEPGALVVKIDAATVCGSDLHIWANHLGPTYTLPLPLVLGHEMVGEIVELGSGADLDSLGNSLRVGDRVVWANEACGHCYVCTIEREPRLCPARKFVGLTNAERPPHFVGAFAEYGYVFPGQQRLRVDEAVLSEWASAGSCALRTVINTVAAAGGIDFLDSVVIQGAGPLGLFSAAIVSTLNPKHLIVVGAPDDRLRVAEAWGATHTISIAEYPTAEARRDAIAAITGRGGPSVALEVSGAPGAVAEGVAMLRANGRYVLSGTLGGGPQPIDMSRVTTRGLHLTGSMSGDIDSYFKAMEFLGKFRDRFDWGLMLGNRYGLHQVTEALESMGSMREIKPVLDPRLTVRNA